MPSMVEVLHDIAAFSLGALQAQVESIPRF